MHPTRCIIVKSNLASPSILPIVVSNKIVKLGSLHNHTPQRASNGSDGQGDTASASRAVDSGLIPWNHTNDFKIGIHNFSV